MEQIRELQRRIAYERVEVPSYQYELTQSQIDEACNWMEAEWLLRRNYYLEQLKVADKVKMAEAILFLLEHCKWKNPLED